MHAIIAANRVNQNVQLSTGMIVRAYASTTLHIGSVN